MGGTIEGADGNYDVEKKVNTPKIKKGMTAITYTADGKPQDVENVKEEKWYDYKAGEGDVDNTSSEWANAKVTKTYEINGEKKEIESYFVWIPRFAYKITPKTSEAQAGTIDVVFLKNTGNTYIDEDGIEQNATANDYVVHPAFTSDVDKGGWDTELPGLWVGKYETSLIKISDGTAITSSSSDTSKTNKILSDEDKDIALAIQPNKSSWRNITIGNMYDNAKKYASELESHMLKNSEWGAVTYLTHSKYGRNGNEIDINNSYYITGKGGGNPNAKTTSFGGIEYEYNTLEGMRASSTGNIYGIYDLSGGAFEYVAAYYKDGNSNLTNYGSSLKDEINKKYVTEYTSKTAIKGDATTETVGWNRDYNNFIDTDIPFFDRGGYYNWDYNSGIFCYRGWIGYCDYDCSFRVCLVV